MAARSVSPLVALALDSGLIYVNQALFTVYVLRVHDGDVSFIAPYMPAGWFDLATHNPVLRSIARGFPTPELLAPLGVAGAGLPRTPLHPAGLRHGGVVRR
ncbi:hypothetical protein ACFRIB_20265 [Streptomyces mirabilis]|uniref:hypothetical protein n=1 Tax=Streptomyces mirabilis TaxID=68239 RepID=UPI0036C02481